MFVCIFAMFNLAMHNIAFDSKLGICISNLAEINIFKFNYSELKFSVHFKYMIIFNFFV